jgi:hypothetical protein
LLSKYPALLAATVSLILTGVEVAHTANQFAVEGIPYLPILQVFLCLTVLFFVPFAAVELLVKLVKKLL